MSSSLLFAQLTHATGLKDVCDALRHRQPTFGIVEIAELFRIRAKLSGTTGHG